MALELLHLTLALINCITLGLVLTLFLGGKHVLLELRVKFLVSWAVDVELGCPSRTATSTLGFRFWQIKKLFDLRFFAWNSLAFSEVIIGHTLSFTFDCILLLLNKSIFHL